MIEISNEEITNKMFFIREENSNQPIAVIKVGDLMKFERPQGDWIHDYRTNSCSVCNFTTVIDTYNFCPICGADMRGLQND